MSKKTRTGKCCIIASLLMALLLVLCACGDTSSDAGEQTQGDGYRNIKIEELTGTVYVNDEAAYANLLLSGNDRIVVENDSTLTLCLDGNKYLHIGEQSELLLKATGSDKKTRTNIYVVEGETLVEVKEKLTDEESFYISSTNAVMAIRGTVVGINVKKVSGKAVAAYTVYKGKTDLVVMDKDEEGNVISSKLESITEGKFNIEIPEEKMLDEESVIDMSDQVVTETEIKQDVEQANSSLAQVKINRSETSFEEEKIVFQKLVESFSDKEIEYTVNEFDGVYDGKAHTSTVSTTAENAVIKYSSTGSSYSEGNIEYTNPGEYTIYFKITADGYSPAVGKLKLVIKANADICKTDGHKLGEWHEAVPATCTADGTLGYFECSVCRTKFDENKNELNGFVQKALGHIPEKHNAAAATCATAGSIEYYTCANEPGVIYADKGCTIQVAAENVILPQLEHEYGELHPAVEATCQVRGTSAYYQCSLCNGYFDANKKSILAPTITMKGHDYLSGGWHLPKDANCMEDGMLGYWQCSMCKKYFDFNGKEITTDLVIPAKDHKAFAVYHPQTAGTCCSVGNIEYWQCESCGAYFTNAECRDEEKWDVSEKHIAFEWSTGVDSDNHTNLVHFDAKDATCADRGNYEYYYCEGCKYYFDGNMNRLVGANEVERIFIPATGVHTWGGWEKTDSGEVRTCTVCGEKDYIHYCVHDADHLEYHSAKNPATCIDSGNTEYWQCPECGSYFKDANGRIECTWDEIEYYPDPESLPDDSPLHKYGNWGYCTRFNGTEVIEAYWERECELCHHKHIDPDGSQNHLFSNVYHVLSVSPELYSFTDFAR